MQGPFYESGSCVPKSCAILGIHPTELRTTWEQNPRLRCHIWVRTPTKAIESSSIWRKRVGVEPTIRPAKDRITGFEGRESHRTLFASENSIVEHFADAQGNVRSDGRPLRRLAACGSERQRGRKARDWYRLRNRDVK